MPHEIAVTKDGNIVLSARQNHPFSVFKNDGQLVKRVGEYGEGINAKGCEFSEPNGLAVSANGDIYICDRYIFSKINSKWRASNAMAYIWYF